MSCWKVTSWGKLSRKLQTKPKITKLKISKVKYFVTNGEEFLRRNLTKTMQDLTGPSGSLQNLTKSVQSLQNDVRDMKSKKEEDEQGNEKRSKADSTAQESNRSADRDPQAGLSIIDDQGDIASPVSSYEPVIKCTHWEEDLFTGVEDNEEEGSLDILEDLDQYFDPRPKRGQDVRKYGHTG